MDKLLFSDAIAIEQFIIIHFSLFLDYLWEGREGEREKERGEGERKKERVR